MYATILVPLDGSKRAEQILPHVEELARRYEAKIVLFRVIEPPTMVAEGSAMQFEQDYEQHKSDVETYLSGLAEKFQGKKLQVKTRTDNGLIVESILDAAESEGADLIAIASHGRSGLARVFYGSVAAGVLHRIDRPLLLIRSK
ncbi:MAG: universal stress protein [Desulfohalobiaceae bacterium]|nr:universal stress protein [Desulfohalobiaceae bacterium]